MNGEDTFESEPFEADFDSDDREYDGEGNGEYISEGDGEISDEEADLSEEDEEFALDLEQDGEAAVHSKRGCGCAKRSQANELDEFDEIEELDEVDELVELDEPTWPPLPKAIGPPSQTIPSGPYKTGGPLCEMNLDFGQLKRRLEQLDAQIQQLRKLRREPPERFPYLNSVRRAAMRNLDLIKEQFRSMRERVTNGTYRRTGCRERHFAILTCRMRTLHGIWCNSPELKKLRCELVYTLRKARGRFARVPCARLGVKLKKHWCRGHNCCCP